MDDINSITLTGWYHTRNALSTGTSLPNNSQPPFLLRGNTFLPGKETPGYPAFYARTGNVWDTSLKQAQIIQDSRTEKVAAALNSQKA